MKYNQGRIDEDPFREQDDVAPQRGIPIFINLGGDETVTEQGRVFIKSSIKKGWLKSHSEGSYEWMFNQELLNIIDRGYVKPKQFD